MLKATRLRWLVIARLESAGLGCAKIAECTMFHPMTVQRVLDSAAYQEWRNARFSNGISAIDHIISGDAKEMKLALRELVPAAIHALGNALADKDPSIRMRAAAEILDRDERFNKQAVQVIQHTYAIPEAEKQRALAIIKELKVHPAGESKVLDVTPKQLTTS